MTYKFEHSIQCPVSREVAWGFWTNVANWPVVDSSAESVTIDGPFAAGAKGETKSRDLPPIEWEIREVQEGHRAVIEILLPGAILQFLWLFEELTVGSTSMRQVVSLEGERAHDYLEGMALLEKGIPEGMKSLAQGMVNAARASA